MTSLHRFGRCGALQLAAAAIALSLSACFFDSDYNGSATPATTVSDAPTTPTTPDAPPTTPAPPSEPTGAAITPTSIAVQPRDADVIANATASFTVAALGQNMAYQWQQSTDGGSTWANIADAVATAYAVRATSSLNGAQYRAVVTGSVGTATSSPVTLTVSPQAVAPQILVDVAPATVTANGNAVFNVTATGTALGYQWQSSTDGINFSALAGEHDATLHLNGVTAADDGRQLRVVIGNGAGLATSSNAVLTVAAAPAAPAIVGQPSPHSVVAPTGVVFAVQAQASTALAYQWQRSDDGGLTFSDLPGATGDSLAIATTALIDDGAQFRVRIGNAAGVAMSDAASLSVAAASLPPAITTQPASVVVAGAGTVRFAAAASGSPQPGLQWQVSVDRGLTWVDIVGQTGASYSFTTTLVTDSGRQFRVVAGNSLGAAISGVAELDWAH